MENSERSAEASRRRPRRLVTSAFLAASFLLVGLSTVVAKSVDANTACYASGLSSTSSSFAPSTSVFEASPTFVSSPASTRSFLTMKVSSGQKRGRSQKGSSLTEINNERIRTAGRRGTKNFVDPSKIFIGNLPFDADEADIEAFFEEQFKGGIGQRIESIKVIRDWKTGKSKGYGFINFFEPLFATSAMESVRNQKIKGRVVRLSQGSRKKEEGAVYVKKNRKEIAPEDEEGAAIGAALAEAEDGVRVVDVGSDGVSTFEDEEEVEEGGMTEDEMITFMEKGGLRGVMPLTEENAGFLGIEGLYDDDDDYFDDDDTGDDTEFKFDGVFEDEYDPKQFESLNDEEAEEREKMNREQRRTADKTRKKRKLPFRGFGNQK